MTYWITEAPGTSDTQGGENGYSILPGGAIIMWGTFTGDGDKVNFHRAFPNNCFAVNFTGTSGQLVNPKIASKDRFGFVVHHRESRRSGFGQHATTTGYEAIHYVAVGN